MLKTKAFIEYNGKQIQKIFTAGQLVKIENKNGKNFINLSHYKGKDVPAEYTNNIQVDDKKIGALMKLKKGTQLFCDINLNINEKDGKTYENLFLFAFEIGREGRGDVFGNNVTPDTNVDEDDDVL